MVLLGGGKAKLRAIYVVAGLIPLCLFAALVVDRSGHSSALLATNPALLAAADLERAAALELKAAGVPSKSQSLFARSDVFQTIKEHDAKAAAPAPPSLVTMSDSESREELNAYFDSYKSADASKLAAKPAAQPTEQPTAQLADQMTNGDIVPASKYQLLQQRLGKQDAVINQLKDEVKTFEASLKMKEQEQEQAKADSQVKKQEMAAAREKLAAQQQQQKAEQQQHQQSAAMALAQQALPYVLQELPAAQPTYLLPQQQPQQQQQAFASAVQAAAAKLVQQQQQQQQQQQALAVAQQHAAAQAAATAQAAAKAQAAAQHSQTDLERAIGEAVLGHSSASRATANLAKLLEPKGARSAFTAGQRVHRDMFGMPMITSQDQAKLPGVNVAEWADPRVEHEVASSVWQRTHPLNSVEGGSQLASFAVPAAAPTALACPICAFNEDCSINLKARGFHRASGLSDNMPPYHGAITPYGGGGVHMSSLHAVDKTKFTKTTADENKPLWDKLKLADTARTQELALNAAEGGQQLASFAVPPPVIAAPEPVQLCECPRCKLGEEQLGFGDELHGKQELEDPELLQTIDDELMKLDPAYALRRVDGTPDQTAAVLYANQVYRPTGKANPLSDFSDVDNVGTVDNGFTNGEYSNQVERKSDTVF